jgi:hypothetical protein
MKNKFYRVDFCGHYPVGAVAVMIAYSKQEALNLFQTRLQAEEPTLVEFNTDLTVDNVVELTERCTVLLNGDY